MADKRRLLLLMALTITLAISARWVIDYFQGRPFDPRGGLIIGLGVCVGLLASQIWGPKTAADLVRFGASVKIDCRGCGASRTLSGPEVVKGCGPGSLKDCERRLKCSRCGGKEAWMTILPPL
jgi:hypothetical protein